jgi:hypothetical protein
MHHQPVRRGDRRCHAGGGRQRQRSFSAVQQLAPAIGAAIVTGIYFRSAPLSSASQRTASSFTVAMIIVACLGLVWLLPGKGAEG